MATPDPTTRPTPELACPRPALVLALAGMLAGTLAAGGCAKGRTRDAAKEDAPTNAGLANLTRDDAALTIDPPPADDFEPTRQWALQAASQLEEIMDRIPGSPTYDAVHAAGADQAATGAGRSGRSGEAAPSGVVAGAEEPTQIAEPAEPAEPTRFSLAAFAGEDDADTAIDAADGQTPPELAAGQPEPEPAAEPAPAAVAGNPEARKQQLVDELVGVLGELARSGEGPGSAALALAGLESLRPQALDALKGEGLLSDAEIASLDAARALFAAMSSEDGIAGPGEVSGVLDRIRRDLDARAGLRIARAELCTRVTGFGRYETFGANRFVAGRPQPVIVYTEVDRFAHRETTGPDGQPRFGIEVSQRLELYHTADNLNTWNRAAETDRTESRNRVRDYYLINQVTLPSNLSIGKYHLKVVMRDLVGGHLAETIIPIEIVASTTASGL